MKSEIIELKISDLGEIVTGNTPPTSQRNLYGGQYPLIMPTDMVEGDKYIGATAETLSEAGFKKYKKCLLPSNTPCIVTIGSLGKKLCLTKEPSFTNQAVNAIKVYGDKFDSNFVFYLMKYNLPQVKYLSNGTASGRENVSKSSFGRIKVKLSKNTIVQQKIATILSAYDELIENNKQRIKLLEEMAVEGYKEWFVRLRFPGYKSNITTDGLPEGWENGTLGQLVEFKKGRNITLDTVINGNVPVVAGGLAPAYFHNEANTRSPTITISASGANAGYVNLYYENIWASDCSFLDIASTNFIYFFYLTLKIRQTEVTFLQKGSAQPHVYPKDIMSLKMVKPDSSLIERFTKTITPFFGEIKALSRKCILLQETRDLLLPRLISGKLSVEHLIEETESLLFAAKPTIAYENRK